MKESHALFILVLVLIGWAIWNSVSGPIPASAYHAPPTESGGLNF